MSHYEFGAYRRRIRLVNASPDTVEAGLEDDFHHFEVTLRHDGTRITDVAARALRWPWTTCPDAAVPLRSVAGLELSPRCMAIGGHADPRLNCTHMFDLTGLAAAHAARGGAPGTTRQYDVEVPYLAQNGGEVPVRLWRDSELLHTWVLDGRHCVSPPPYSETRWHGGFLRWADETFGPEQSESVIVLRRACDIGMGRGMDLDAVERADEMERLMSGVCYTMQPGPIRVALRNKATVRDFDAHPELMLEDGP